MNYAVNNQIILSLVPQGPIAAYLDSFSRSLVAQGYRPHYIHQQVWLAACFSQWLEQTSVRLRGISSAHAVNRSKDATPVGLASPRRKAVPQRVAFAELLQHRLH